MWFSVGIALAAQNERDLKNLALFVYKAFNRRKTLLLCRTWRRYDIYIYIRMRWTNNRGHYCNILLYITFRFGYVHLQHSNVSKLITVCALHYKVYCAYTPSNGAMALLNKISVFRIPYSLSPLVGCEGQKKLVWLNLFNAGVSPKRYAGPRGCNCLCLTVLYMSLCLSVSLAFSPFVCGGGLLRHLFVIILVRIFYVT